MAVSQLSILNSRHSLLLPWIEFSRPSRRTTNVKMALDSAYRTSSRARNEEHDPRGLVMGTTVRSGIRESFAFEENPPTASTVFAAIGIVSTMLDNLSYFSFVSALYL